MEVLFARTIDGGLGSTATATAPALCDTACRLLASLDRPLGVDAWLSAVKGAQLGDAVPLVAHDRVRVARSSSGAVDGCVEQRLFDALRAMTSDALYTLLTRQARVSLGLMRGFRLILAVEKSNTYEARQHLAIWMALDLCRRQDAEGLRSLVERVLGPAARVWLEAPTYAAPDVAGAESALKLP